MRQDFRPDQVEDIVRNVIGKDKLVRELETGRELFVYGHMEQSLLKNILGQFCQDSNNHVIVVEQPPGPTSPSL